jgi:prepilin-type N-terminal cleavage/methylation domain-containing protein
MINKKGFTLMELLVAVFIGGMVSMALVSIWKAASLQTSKARKQTMERNNRTFLLRSMYNDITSADSAIAEFRHIPGSSFKFLVTAKNAIVVGNQFVVLSSSPAGAARGIIYCQDHDGKVYRDEEKISNGLFLKDFSTSNVCAGKVIMGGCKSCGYKVSVEKGGNYLIKVQDDYNLEYSFLFTPAGAQ